MPSGRVMDCTMAAAGAEHRLGHAFQHLHVRRGAQIPSDLIISTSGLSRAVEAQSAAVVSHGRAHVRLIRAGIVGGFVAGKASSPISATAIEATRIGPGQRTIAVPIRRQPRVRIARFGSNNPIVLPIVMTAGVRVSEATRVTSTPMPGRDAQALEVASW